MADARQREMVHAIHHLGGGKHRPIRVFADWVEMLAIALANGADKSRFEAREARYLEIVRGYTKGELDGFAELSACLVGEFSSEQDGITFDDVLGRLFMACEFGGKFNAQFFTPYPLCRLTAKMTMMGNECQDALQRRGFVRANDPACGAGGMCIALAESLHDGGINHQQCLHVTAQDIDSTCVHMAYIQLTLLRIPAVVILGDTLALEQRQHWFTPAHVMGLWNERQRISNIFEKMRALITAEPKPPEEPRVPLAVPLAATANGQFSLF